MKREEEIEKKSEKYADNDDNLVEWSDSWKLYDEYNEVFNAFKSGAKWADKTLIDKACEWMEFNYAEYLNNSRVGINMKEMIEDFRKAMEE